MIRFSVILKFFAFFLLIADYAMEAHPTFAVPCCLFAIGCLLGSVTITTRTGKSTQDYRL